MRVLYLVYWGALEPLGRSLVVPAVRELAREGVDLTLVTYEKPLDLQRVDDLQAVGQVLRQAGVRWHPLHYHKRPKVPATFFDILHGWARGIALRRSWRYDLVHARTFIAGNVGLLLAPAARVPLVYHNEGFYAEEQIDAGVWHEGSFLYRFARRLEARLYCRAQGLILLSARSRTEILARPCLSGRGTPSIVVPSCVDLDLFPAPSPRPAGDQGPLRLVYVGNVEGRYQFHRIARFAAIAARQPGGARLSVLTRAPEHLVLEKAQAAGLPPEDIAVAAVPHERIPAELAEQDAGLHFLPQGRAEHAGSPTKLGEYWASGLPVLVTPGIGDSEDIIRGEGVGVILREHGDEAYADAARRLRQLSAAADTRARCRAAAEQHYALSPSVRRQVALYEEVLARRRAST